MKKVVKYLSCVTSVALTACFLMLAMFGCTKAVRTVSDVTTMLGVENLADDVMLWTGNGNTLPYSDDGYGFISYHFDTPKTFNTVALSEDTKSITEFEILVKTNDVWTKVYRQDNVRALRYSAFTTVSASAVKIRFQSEGMFSISSVGIYHVEQAEKEFHVVSYLIVNDFLDYEAFDKTNGIQSFESVTDIILFGGAEIKADGSIVVSDDYYRAFENVKRVERQLNKRFNVYANFENSKEYNDASAVYISAMDGNKNKLIAQLDRFLKESATDGISFSWRFIETTKGWNVFSNFLSALDQAIEPGRKITVAFASWNNSLSKAAISALDLVQIMSYDLVDDTKNHGSFSLVLSDLDKFLKKGFPLSKLVVGIPFYARETVGGSQLWFPYRDDAQNLGRSYNVIQNPSTLPNGEAYIGERYYNGYFMVRDKVAYAYDVGAGGVMFWSHSFDCHYDAQNNGKNLSLIRAIAEQLSYR